MAETVIVDLTNYKNSPIRRLVLTDAVTADRIQLISATSESKYDVTPITRRDGYGNDRIVAWRFEAIFIPIHNNVGTMLRLLDGWDQRTVSAGLFLKADSSQPHSRLVSISLVNPIGLTWLVTKSEYGPEIRITISRVLKSLYQYGASSTTFWADGAETIPEPNP
jgi:hypothetical protein